MNPLIKKMRFNYFFLFLTSVFTVLGIFTPHSDRANSFLLNEVSLELSRIPAPSTTKNAVCDLSDKTIDKRIIIIDQPIDADLADRVISQLLYLDAQAPGKDIYMYINSSGGSVPAGMSIYDAMQILKSNVVTVSTGQSASMAALLLAGGTKGKRFALPHSQIMIHQTWGQAQGGTVSIEIQEKEIAYLKKTINQLLSDFTGQPLERIQIDTKQDFWMSAQEAKTYGMIDKVIDKLPICP